MPTRTLNVALWDHQDADGRWLRAFYCERVDVTVDELHRGDLAGVFASEPDPVVAEDDPWANLRKADATPSATAERPVAVSTKPALIKWLIDQGHDADQVKHLDKTQLWQIINGDQNVDTNTAATQQDSTAD